MMRIAAWLSFSHSYSTQCAGATGDQPVLPSLEKVFRSTPLAESFRESLRETAWTRRHKSVSGNDWQPMGCALCLEREGSNSIGRSVRSDKGIARTLRYSCRHEFFGVHRQS